MSEVTGLVSSEIADLGEKIYDRIRSVVDPGNDGRFLAIDVISGDYEIGDDGLTTAMRLKERHSASEVFGMRIGYAAAVAIGGRLPRDDRSAA